MAIYDANEQGLSRVVYVLDQSVLKASIGVSSSFAFEAYASMLWHNFPQG
jgi:hypothetical protein